MQQLVAPELQLDKSQELVEAFEKQLAEPLEMQLMEAHDQ